MFCCVWYFVVYLYMYVRMISLGRSSVKGQPLLFIKDLFNLSNVVEALVEVTDEPIFGAEYIHVSQENKQTRPLSRFTADRCERVTFQSNMSALLSPVTSNNEAHVKLKNL